MGRFQADQTELWLRRAHTFRRSPRASAVTILDIAYDDLVHDTAGVLGRIYDAAGLTPDDSTGMIDHYHAAHPRNAKGAHHYTPHDFALDETNLRTRFAPLTAPGL